jgi:tight adherence protein B
MDRRSAHLLGDRADDRRARRGSGSTPSARSSAFGRQGAGQAVEADRRWSATGPSLLRGADKRAPDWLEGALQRIPRASDLQSFLEQAGTTIGVFSFLVFSMGYASAFGFLATAAGGSLLTSGFVAVIGAALPYLFFARKRRKRMEKFEEHLPDAIDLLGRAIRAGHALSTGLGMVAEEAEEPVASEFRQVFEEQKYGLPIGESFQSLTDRITLPDLQIFTTAVLIQRDVGGNLAEILDKLSYVIRERFKFRRQLRTHTAQGRLTGIILGVAPIVAGVGMFVLNPEYMMPLLTKPAGRMLLMAAVGLQLFGFLVIRRITDVEF